MPTKETNTISPSGSGTSASFVKLEREERDHPLQSAWSFWYDKKQSKRKDSPSEFREQLQKVASFDSVEGFWKIYCYLKRPSALDINVNLYLFRDGAHHV